MSMLQKSTVLASIAREHSTWKSEFRAFGSILIGSLSTLRRIYGTGAKAILALGMAAYFFALLLSSGSARADCSSGDGIITSPGVCAVPQNLTGPTGLVVNGATLQFDVAVPTYTVSSGNATVTNFGIVNSCCLSPGAFAAVGNGAPQGSIVNLVNNGTITSSGTAVHAAPTSGFLTLNITNTGLISGDIRYAPGSAGGTITQAGGVIDGSIFPSGFGTIIRVTGGAINGAIFDSTPASGGAGSSQARGGSLIFDLGDGTFTTNGAINLNSVTVHSGTVVLQNDVYVSNSLSNNAVLRVSGLRTITGNFAQGPTGTLVMQVSPNGSSQLKINRLPFFGGRTASLAGTLALDYQPGTYRPRSYTLISTDVSNANGSFTNITGSFSRIVGSVPTLGLSQSVTIDPNEVDLTLSQAANPATPASEIVVSPSKTTIYPAMTSMLVLNGQRVTGILLDRLGSRQAGIADGPFALSDATGAPVRTVQASNIGTLVGIGSALPEVLGSAGAWFRGIGGFASVNGNSGLPGFNGKSGGLLAGFDRPIMPNVSLGLAAGYQHSDVDEHLTSGTVDSGRVAVYGGGWWGPNLFTGTAGYAYDRISSNRGVTDIGTATEGHNGHEFSIAGQWSVPIPVRGLFGLATLTPKLGVQYLNLHETRFHETGANAFDLSAGSNDTDSLQPFAAFAAAEKFITADGSEITPELRLGYSREVLNNNRILAIAATDATPFLARGVRPSRDMLTAGIGFTLRAQGNIFVYANYDAVLPTGNTSDQTVSGGLRIRF
jgi:outer membrane autotransporter protein